jgi:AcrR family transcriptional regulator
VTELRADARRNREELLDVARQVIREQGVDASLRDIARRAGVGIATLYRHFPNRDDLIAAIIGDGVQRLSQHAAELSASLPPGEALEQWLGYMAARIGPYHGLPDAMHDAITTAGSTLNILCNGMMTAGDVLLTRAQAGGAIRADVTWPDVFTAVAAISAIATKSGPDTSARILAVYLDGLRTAAATGSAAAPAQPGCAEAALSGSPDK